MTPAAEAVSTAESDSAGEDSEDVTAVKSFVEGLRVDPEPEDIGPPVENDVTPEFDTLVSDLENSSE